MPGKRPPGSEGEGARITLAFRLAPGVEIYLLLALDAAALRARMVGGSPRETIP
jgi:hypothetical protein